MDLLTFLLVNVLPFLALGLVTHQIAINFTRNGETISHSVSKTGGQEINISEAIADSSTDLEIVGFTADISAMESLYMVSDQAVTLETNDGTTPQETISLAASTPLVWLKSSGMTNPFSDDVTALYVTNASGSTANLEIRLLQDPTP